MRSARETFQVPPVRYLRLPWPEFGETDYLLNVAMDILKTQECSCGCGQWADECQDEATEDRWQVRLRKCYAREAMNKLERDHGPELRDYVMSVELLPAGQVAQDPLQPDRFDPEVARREFAAQQKRLGLA